jgi:hypothetical protein
MVAKTTNSTTTAAYRSLRDKLIALDAKLSGDERIGFRKAFPTQLFKSSSEAIDFLFAAPEEILDSEELEVFSRLGQIQDVDLSNRCALHA